MGQSLTQTFMKQTKASGEHQQRILMLQERQLQINKAKQGGVAQLRTGRESEIQKRNSDFNSTFFPQVAGQNRQINH